MLKESKPIGIRIPISLKERIAIHAKKQGKSLNAEIIQRLQKSFGSTARIIDDIFDTLNLEKIQRMRSTSTQADKKRIITVLRNMGVDKIVLGARREQLNNAVLVFIAQTESITLLMDSTNINMARTSRELEVQDIFHELDKNGLLEHIEYCKDYLPTTSNLTPDKALQLILEKGNLQKIVNITDFLRIFSVHEQFDADEFFLQG